MPRLSEITYSRENTIAAVRNYYHFLTKLYLPESAVFEPPTDGWPNITTENMRFLNKSDEVIELLRYLPYIHHDELQEIQAAAETQFMDWSDESYRDGKDDNERCENVRGVTEGTDRVNVPSHVVGLTFGGRNTSMMLLDTQLGVVYWSEWCPDDIAERSGIEPVLEEAEEYEPEHEWNWRDRGQAWAVADFFEVLKSEFRSLRFLPVNEEIVKADNGLDGDFTESTDKPDHEAEGSGTNDEEAEGGHTDEEAEDGHTDEDEEEDVTFVMARAVKAVYVQHGWPSIDVYDKEPCLKAIQQMLKTRFPDEIW